MSSTNRGKQRNRKDNYPTPAWCVYRLLDAKPSFLAGKPSPIGPRRTILEPCAGDGVIIRAFQIYEVAARWDAVEIRKGKKIREALAGLAKTTAHHEDIFKFLSHGGLRYDLALTNPPFSLAWRMIHDLWPVCDHICFLLRLNFFGSEQRHMWLQKNMPDVYILPNRPRFGLNKHGLPGTDSIEYAWFHWNTKKKRAKGSTYLLGLTPLKDRR